MTKHPFGFNETQVEALWASAEHWLENWQDVENASSSGADCACCEEVYNEQYDDDNLLGPCQDCPIAQYMNTDSCNWTPWHDAAQAIREVKGVVKLTTKEDAMRPVEKEYRFLVSLALGEKP